MSHVTITTHAGALDAYRNRDLRQALYDAGEVVMADVLVNLHGAPTGTGVGWRTVSSGGTPTCTTSATCSPTSSRRRCAHTSTGVGPSW